MGWARGSIKTTRNWRRTLLTAMVILAAAAALWMAWSAWLAPTRVALVHYPDFQAARLLKASPGAFTGYRRYAESALAAGCSQT